MAVATVGMLVYSIIGVVPWWVPLALPSLAIVLAFATLARWTGERLVLGGAAVIIAGFITGAWLIRGAATSGIDVVRIHEAAASALAHGENICRRPDG